MVLLRECLLCLRRPISRSICSTAKLQISSYVGIVDAAVDKGQRKIGVAEAPHTLRKAGLIKKLTEDCSANVKDYGQVAYQESQHSKTVDVPPNMLNYEHVIHYNKNLSRIVQNVIRDGRICLTLGGDHSIGLGSVSGHCKAKGSENIALLWVDAHADINTNTTSPSGNMHGMPVALLAEELDAYWTDLPLMDDGHLTRISLRNMAFIGLRSIDPYEEWLIEKMGITCYDITDVQKRGMDAVISGALKQIDPDGTKSIHLSFDIDALDPSEAPSTGTRVSGGLLLREGIYIASTIHNTGRLGVMDLVEVNPSIGNEDDVERTVNSAIQVIMAAFGYGRRGVRPGLPELKRMR